MFHHAFVSLIISQLSAIPFRKNRIIPKIRLGNFARWNYLLQLSINLDHWLFAFLKNKGKKSLINITILGACFIGLFQCFALIPGASRSGAAISAGLLIGLSLKDASKFAFLLAIPTILGALTLLIFDLNNGNVSFDLLNISIGFFTSMIFAFFTIKLFLKLVEQIGLIPFVAYRFLLGILLLII